MNDMLEIWEKYEKPKLKNNNLNTQAEPLKPGVLKVNTELKQAMEVLLYNLRNDPDYYRAWKDNIAMAFKDEYNGTLDENKEFIHQISNNAADNFLRNLTLR